MRAFVGLDRSGYYVAVGYGHSREFKHRLSRDRVLNEFDDLMRKAETCARVASLITAQPGNNASTRAVYDLMREVIG